ncbi:signal peptidase I, partial [Gottfriedia luciferensis]|uniref:signal peptidase I n=1 Tax=Gottfriedia luciferensis TaxID=178774 RepID=UPI000B43AE94
MNIFMREMRTYRKSIIFWCIGIIFLVGTGMAKYKATASNGQITELFHQMPKSLQAIMGSGALDLSKASGYFGILVLYLFLMATIHAAMIGSNIIAKEERDKTAEFLFVKPISRIITHRISAVHNKNGEISYKTKGDNNDAPDLWTVYPQNIIGNYSNFTIPYVGYALNFVSSKTGSALLLVVPGILLTLSA